MLSSMLSKGFLTENVTVDAKAGTVTVDTPAGEKVVPVDAKPEVHVDAVDNTVEKNELQPELEHEEDMNNLSEAASEVVRAADDCYILVENTVARIDAKCASIILAEAAGQDMADDKNKVNQNAGKGIIASLLARLKSLLASIGKMIERVKVIIYNKTTNLSKMVDSIAPQVQANITNGKYKEYSYTGHKWNLGNMTGAKLSKVIEAVDELVPIAPLGTKNVELMKSKLEELTKDGWSIDDFKNKIVKTVFGSSKISDLPKELYSKVAGEAMEIKGFTAIAPSKMVSALKNISGEGTLKQTMSAYDEIKKAINSSIAGAEKLSGAFATVDAAERNVMSEYVAKRISVLQVALGIVTTVANTENKIILEMSYEFAKALNGLAKMK